MWARILYILLFSNGAWRAPVLIRLAQHLHRRGAYRLERWAAHRLRREFGCFVQPTAEIGPGLRLPHPNGIVIGDGARIGARCAIYHQVTFGNLRIEADGRRAYPSIGDDVTVFAGAKLVGGITVGDGAVIGANAVVNRNVPARHSATGVPAVNRPLGS